MNPKSESFLDSLTRGVKRVRKPNSNPLRGRSRDRDVYKHLEKNEQKIEKAKERYPH